MFIQKYTFGMGDRFAHSGIAQLRAVQEANNSGIPVYPVWNKSFREHSIVGSHPHDLRLEADAATKELGWLHDYYVDADHIGLKTVEGFLDGSNFYTLDVADYVDAAPTDAQISEYINQNRKFIGSLLIPGIETPFEVTESTLEDVAKKFLIAIKEAGKIYSHIKSEIGSDAFITEVSIDETDRPQTPIELFLILSMIAAEGIPAQTIAPKFTGRFNKGVDYNGDLMQFEKEFDQDLYVIDYAIKQFNLPNTLKLSVHSGSDKFSIYPIIQNLILKHNAGLHVKTAGTTWLEEVIGLAESGGHGLDIAKKIYAGAHSRFDALTAPYSTVIDIDQTQLPTPDDVQQWSAEKYVNTLRHDQNCLDYNIHFRQLIHVGFKIAAELGDEYIEALKSNQAIVHKNVTLNLLERHIHKIFPRVGIM